MWFSGKQKSRPFTRSGLYTGLGGSINSSRLAAAWYRAREDGEYQMEMAETTEELPCALISRTKTVTTIIFLL